MLIVAQSLRISSECIGCALMLLTPLTVFGRYRHHKLVGTIHAHSSHHCSKLVSSPPHTHTLFFTTSSPLPRWCENTLAFFPTALRLACDTPTHTDQLLTRVDEETKKFQSLTSEMEQTRLFTETESASLFLWCVCMCVFCGRGNEWVWLAGCSVLWKVTVETGVVSSVLLKIAQRTQPKKLAAFMRRFVDYVVLSLPNTSPAQETQLETVYWKILQYTRVY